MGFLTYRHDVYDRGDILDCHAESIVLEEQLCPYMKEHKLLSLNFFRLLINNKSIRDISVILATIATTVACWKDRLLAIGINDRFILDIGIRGSLNCTQLQAMFWTKCGEEEAVEAKLKEVFSPLATDIGASIIMDVDWFSQNKDDGVCSMTIKEVVYETIHPESYPYLDLKNFIAGYFKSSSSVLLLSGVPGTGKTKLIRHIIRTAAETKPEFMTQFRMKHHYPVGDDDYEYASRAKLKEDNAPVKVAYTTDVDVLTSDAFYTRLRANNFQFVVLEDIDFKLSPRKEGNDLMHKFLAMSDGFVSTNCKIILSTNLNVGEIDSALTRPGRCYSSVETRRLSFGESNALLNLLGKRLELDPRIEYTLAELYGMAYNLTYKAPKVEKRVGFGAR